MIASYGEILLRMSPALEGKWINESTVPVHVGGAELNVAGALALWGEKVRYITAMPDNYIAREVLHDMTQRGIDASAVHFSGERIGIYYLPQGTDLKNAGVVYDRAHSSFAGLKPGMIEWSKALEGCDWFHFSAISPALSRQAALVCEEALEVADKLGLTISVDLNYRSKLWQYGEEPSSIMKVLAAKAHYIMGNLWSVESLLGIKSSISDSEGKSREELIEAAAFSMRTLQDHYPRAKAVAFTFRLDDLYYAVLRTNDTIHESREFFIKQVVDRVGSGDCFMAGLIYGIRNGFAPGQVIDFAATAAVGKLAEKGDSTRQSLESILQQVEVKA